MEETNGKATIREVRDLIDKLDDEKISPMRLDIATIKTLLTEHIKNYKEDCNRNDEVHKKLDKKASNGISVKAFASWLSVTTIIITTIIALVTLFLK